MLRSQGDDINAGAYYFEAMFAVVAIEVAIAREHVEGAAALRIRKVVVDALASWGMQVRAYAQIVADEAEVVADALEPWADGPAIVDDDPDEGRRDGLADCCARRSVLQFLIDAGSPAAASIEREDIEAHDHELRRIISYGGPLPASEVPPGIPRSHWWWYPPPDRDSDHEAEEARG